MLKATLAAAAGGLIVFFWSAFAHMALPLGTMGLSILPNESTILSEFKKTIQTPGLYIFPGRDMSKEMTESERSEWHQKAKEGPTGILVIQPTGAEPVSPKQLGTELGSNIAAAFVAAIVLLNVSGGYLVRVRMLVLLAIFSWLSLSVSYWNWYGFPSDFMLAELIMEAVGWLLAGLAMAAIVKPSTPQSKTPIVTT